MPPYFLECYFRKMSADEKDDQTPKLNNRLSEEEEVPELVASGPDDRNWRGIGIAVVVIVCVCALIITAVVLLTPGDKNARTGKSPIQLEEFLSGAFSYRSFNGTWISGHEFIFQDSAGAVEIYNVLNNSRQVIMPNATFEQNNVAMYTISPDRQYILLARKIQRVFRHAFKASFLVYNLSSDSVFPLFPETPDISLQHASWGPTGSQLVFVMNDNIYYMSNIEASPKQITNTGIKNIIFNGIPDWLYEEEILSSGSAMWWSKDGKKLCFATFNNSLVDDIRYSYYGSRTDLKNVYPEIIDLKYPKSGRTNPTVALYVVDMTSDNLAKQEVKPPNEYQGTDYYFTNAQFRDSESLSVTWLKRAQNSSVISICQESKDWACDENLQENANGDGWIELFQTLLFTDDGRYYFVLLPALPEGSAGRFQHIAMVDTKSGTKEFLTRGKFDVVKILAYDNEKKTVYYMTTLEGKPGQRHLYGVTDATAKFPKKTTCYTCAISPMCLWNDVTFASPPDYYVLQCLGPGIPKVQIRSMDSKEIVILDSNQELKEFTDQKALPIIKKLQVPLPGNYKAQVKLQLPPGLREDEITKYPLLLEVYAGPGSQLVKEAFSLQWGSFLASNKNIIFANVDARGSGFQGNKMLHELYRRLGTVEVQDQIAVVEYLKTNLPFIDEDRIAVFGWSYGGYVSSMILSNSEDAGIFKCGISVAPVTNWLYYDSAYTERYMQSPAADDNLINYEKSSVLKKAMNFHGKKFLLVHGTADDNVHWQQSAMLAKALNDQGVLYQMQIYPDERHSLASVKLHLYLTLGKFLDDCYSNVETSDSGER